MATKLVKSQEDEEEENLRKENNLRTDEALKRVSVQRGKSSERGSVEERRKRALESIHRMEWLKNQDDIAVSLQPGTGKRIKERGRKKEREETIKNLWDLSTTAELPPPPPRKAPPAPPAVSAWAVKSGAALFPGTSASYRVTYGIKNYDEERMLGQALQESLMDQERYTGRSHSDYERLNYEEQRNSQINSKTAGRGSSLNQPGNETKEYPPGKACNGTTLSGDESDERDYYEKGRRMAEARAKEREEVRQTAAKERDKEEQVKRAVRPKVEAEMMAFKPRSSLRAPRSSPDSLQVDANEPPETKPLVQFADGTLRPLPVPETPHPPQDQRKMWSPLPQDRPSTPNFAEVAPKFTEVAPKVTEVAPKVAEVARSQPEVTAQIGMANSPVHTEVPASQMSNDEAGIPAETVTGTVDPVVFIHDAKKLQDDPPVASREYTPEELICFEKPDAPANSADSLESNRAAPPFQYVPYPYGDYPGMHSGIPVANPLQYNYLDPGGGQYYPGNHPELAGRTGPLHQAFQGLQLGGVPPLDPRLLEITLYLSRYFGYLGGVTPDSFSALTSQLPKVPLSSAGSVPRPPTPPLGVQLSSMAPRPGFPQPLSTPLLASDLYNPSMGLPGFAQKPDPPRGRGRSSKIPFV